MRLLPLLLVPLLLLTGGTPASAEPVTPRPGTQSFTTVEALVPVVDGPRDDRRVQIDTRLYVPSGATASDPQPAVLMTHGFGLDKDDAEVVSSATFLARHGYVVLTYTSRGFGGSSGCIALQSRPYDVKDAQQLITQVLETRPDVARDARGALVGMVGGSYGGGIQPALASVDDRVRAIVPGRTWSSLQFSLDPNNLEPDGDLTVLDQAANEQGVFKQQWTSLFFSLGNSAPLQQQGGCPEEQRAAGELPAPPCPGFLPAVCAVFARVSSTGDVAPEDRALLATAAADPATLDVPTLLVQGQRDTLFTLNDALRTYTGLAARDVPVKMIWNWGGHGGYDSRPGECEVYGSGTGGPDFRGLDDCYLTLRTLAFLDEHLRGRPDPSPGFTFYRDWVPYGGSGAADEQYGSAPAFPAMPSTVLTLSGSDALVRTGAVAGEASFVNPPGAQPAAYTETSNFSGPDSTPSNPLPPAEQPGQHVSFTSAPFPQGLVSVGLPSATLRLSHTAPNDLVLYGKVYDVAPDGSAELLRRLISPVRVPADAVGEPVTFALQAFAHRFAPGHRVRLVLAATDATSYGNKAPDAITVATGPGSTFSLPGVLPAAAPGTAAPAAPAPGAPAQPAPAAPRAARGELPATGAGVELPLVALVLLGGAWAVRRGRG